MKLQRSQDVRGEANGDSLGCNEAHQRAAPAQARESLDECQVLCEERVYPTGCFTRVKTSVLPT